MAWRILSITLLACEMSAIVWYFEHPLALPFFGIGMKTDLFQSCGHCWHIECSTFTASSFRIWNSSTGIPSPPLAFAFSYLTTSYLSCYVIEITFHVPMQCCSLQHQTLLPSPVTFALAQFPHSFWSYFSTDLQ